MRLPPAGAQGWALAHPGIWSAEARAADRGFLLRHNSLPGQGVQGVPGWGPWKTESGGRAGMFLLPRKLVQTPFLL